MYLNVGRFLDLFLELNRTFIKTLTSTPYKNSPILAGPGGLVTVMLFLPISLYNFLVSSLNISFCFLLFFFFFHFVVVRRIEKDIMDYSSHFGLSIDKFIKRPRLPFSDLTAFNSISHQRLRRHIKCQKLG